MERVIENLRAATPSASQEPVPVPTFAHGREQQLEKSGTGEGHKRVNVVFSSQQYELLRDLARKRGVNVSDILRQAINIMKLVVEANQDGKILIERKGKMQQLKLV